MTSNLEPYERYKEIIDDWDAFQAALKRPLPTCIWANPLKTTPEKLEGILWREKIEFEPLPWRVGAYRLRNVHRPGNRIPAILGLYLIQEEVSMIPVEFLKLEPGLRVLDACAAPGNKTAQIASMMQNRGTVIANDRSFRRLRPLGRTLDRLGVVNTAVMTYDAAAFPEKIGTFDRVLTDVPCSCEGTARKVDTPKEATQSDFDALNATQKAILLKGLHLLRPGGRLVYSTCTYAPEENESIVHQALGEAGEDFTLLPTELEGFSGQPGLVEWQGARFDRRLKNALRVYPHHQNTGGFFVATFARRS